MFQNFKKNKLISFLFFEITLKYSSIIFVFKNYSWTFFNDFCYFFIFLFTLQYFSIISFGFEVTLEYSSICLTSELFLKYFNTITFCQISSWSISLVLFCLEIILEYSLIASFRSRDIFKIFWCYVLFRNYSGIFLNDLFCLVIIFEMFQCLLFF